MAVSFEHTTAPHGEDSALSELLATGEQTRRSLPSQLRHQIGFADPSLFDDELVARTRGLLVHLTAQIAGDRPQGSDNPDYREGRDAILRAVFTQPGLLAHCHALALEYRLTRKLAASAGIDPLLPTLLQELIASPSEPTSRLSSSFLAAQSRFLRDMERMQLPLRQLPAELLNIALGIGREQSNDPLMADAIRQAVQASYDEGATRVALMQRLVSLPDYPQLRGWQVEQTGVPLFLAGLLPVAGPDYHDVVLSTTESQMARLALTLRTRGCNPRVVSRNLLLLHDRTALQVGASTDPATASALLAESAAGHEQDAA